ncbi:MAG TPA: hypothetical protein PLR99_14015 [Polyangiaceae bacterium]|nr:hypothetical protein [Polyangiaceae bacterium]
MKRNAKAVASLGLAALLCGGAAASCSLGLDEGLIGQTDAAPTATTTTTVEPPTDSSTPDAPVKPVDAASDSRAPSTCTRNEDCVTSAICQKGRCDLAAKRCIYEICPQTDRCKVAACNATTGACEAPVDRAFSESFSIIDQVGSTGPFRGIAIVEPFVFVGTNSGVYAYSLQEAGVPKTAIPVAGAAFVPQYLFASGRRLYIVGPLQGSTQRRLAVGWLDVASDPAPAELRAESKYVTFNAPSLGSVFPYPGERMLVGQQSSGSAFGITEPPFGTAIALQTAILPSGLLVANSGERVVLLRAVAGTTAPVLSLVAGPGTPTPSAGADQSIQAGGNASYSFGSGYFATSPAGAVAMSWQMSNSTTPFNGNAVAARLSFILKDDKDVAFSGSDFLDYATFPSPGVPNTSNLAGPIAWADEATVLATYATPSALTSHTNAVFVRRARTDAGVDAGVTAPVELNIAPSSVVGIAAAPGLGALLVAAGGGYQIILLREGCVDPP